MMDTSLAIKLFIMLILSFSIIALLTLIFFVFKNLIKLYIERKHRIVGYKYRTKIVVIFVIITLIPSSLLFLFAGGVITAYIDRWFDPQFEEPLKNSLELSRGFYENERKRTINKARKVIRGEIFRDDITVTTLNALPDNPSETIKNAFEGREGTEVITTYNGDIIRAVIPEIIKGKVRRIFVAESVVPLEITEKIDKIRFASESYTTIKKLKKPLKLNYLLMLAFFTSLIVFMAMWVSLKISKSITDPIGVLAKTTDDIAAGNLNVSINIKRDDEIGMLVNSFNKMVKDLRENKDSLHKAYLEAERRRVFMENIIENIDSGVIFLEENGNIITINTTASRILNIKPSDIAGKNYNFLLNNIKSSELRDFIRGIRLSEFTSTKKQIRANISGRKIVLRTFITQIRDESNRTLGLLVVFEDITGILKAQQALAWQEVAKRMAHEIKNPLTPIKLSAERILKKWREGGNSLNSVIERSIKAIIRETESLQGMVNEFSQLGQMPHMRKELTDIGQLLTEAVCIYSNFENTIDCTVSSGIPLIDVDREQFKRVLVNLIDNANKATSGGGSIKVTADFNSRDRAVKIEVVDTGTGIKDEDKEKLFLPYFSASKEGTGLGLAIVNKIITDHGGTISIRDNKPKGTVFTIELPLKGVQGASEIENA